VLVAPSIHPSGRPYQWDEWSPKDGPPHLALLPSTFAGLTLKRRDSSPPLAIIETGSRHDYELRLGSAMAALGLVSPSYWRHSRQPIRRAFANPTPRGSLRPKLGTWRRGMPLKWILHKARSWGRSLCRRILVPVHELETSPNLQGSVDWILRGLVARGQSVCLVANQTR